MGKTEGKCFTLEMHEKNICLQKSQEQIQLLEEQIGLARSAKKTCKRENAKLIEDFNNEKENLVDHWNNEKQKLIEDFKKQLKEQPKMTEALNNEKEKLVEHLNNEKQKLSEDFQKQIKEQQEEQEKLVEHSLVQHPKKKTNLINSQKFFHQEKTVLNQKGS